MTGVISIVVAGCAHINRYEAAFMKAIVRGRHEGVCFERKRTPLRQSQIAQGINGKSPHNNIMYSPAHSTTFISPHPNRFSLHSPTPPILYCIQNGKMIPPILSDFADSADFDRFCRFCPILPMLPILTDFVRF